MRLLKILAPLLTLLFGMVVKVCFIDEDPSVEHYMFNTYLKPMWLEIFMIALGISFLNYGVEMNKATRKELSFAFVFIGFACTILVFALPRFHVTNTFWINWTPAGLSFILFLIVSSNLTKR